jgi:hypothetical protein
MKHTTKEYRINDFDTFNCKYGTTNRLEPTVIYFSLRTWISPPNDKTLQDVYEKIRLFKEDVKKAINQNDIWSHKHFCHTDFTSLQIETNKKNLLTIEIYVKQNQIIPIKERENDLLNTFSLPIQKLLQSFEKDTFILSKSKCI